MIHLLIIEDNRTKLARIRELVEKSYPEWLVQDAVSYTGGMRRIYNEKWNIILLDMSLPIYDMIEQDNSGNKKAVAGREIMKRMRNRNIQIPTVVITQFETFGENEVSINALNQEFQEELSDIWRGTINYNDATNQWEEELVQILNELERREKDDKSVSGGRSN